MKKYIIAGLLLLNGCQSPDASTNSIDVTDYSSEKVDLPQLVKEKVQAGKTPILYFYADWCGPCRRYRASWQEASVQQALRQAAIVKINIDQDSVYSRLYGIEAVPTFVKIDSTGRPQAIITGDVWGEDTPPNIASAMQKLVETQAYNLKLK